MFANADEVGIVNSRTGFSIMDYEALAASATIKFGVRILFNGEHDEHRIVSSRVQGYWSVDDKVIVIRSQRCLYYTLGTLTHEIAHSQLHQKKCSPDSFRRPYGEAEAYYVEWKTLKQLKVPKKYWRTYWIHHHEQYVEKCIGENRRIYPLRHKEMESLTSRIIHAYQPILDRFPKKSKFKCFCGGRCPEDAGGYRFDQPALFEMSDSRLT